MRIRTSKSLRGGERNKEGIDTAKQNRKKSKEKNFTPPPPKQVPNISNTNSTINVNVLNISIKRQIRTKATDS